MDNKSNLIECHIIRRIDDGIEYLLLQRSPSEIYPNIWQMVTGKIKENEKAYEAAEREIFEETNLQVKKMYVVPHINPFYNEIDDTINYVPVFVAIVNKDLEVTISKEHQAYKWVGKKKAKELLAWPGQAKSVNIIHDYFVKHKENLNIAEIKRNEI